MAYNVTLPDGEKKEIYVDLAPEYTGMRIGPGEGNGFQGDKSLVQIEMNPSGLVVGVRILLEVEEIEHLFVNDVAHKLH